MQEQATTRCTKCRRILRRPTPDGYGPKCRTKVRKAARANAVADFKPAQIEKATELIEQGAIVPLRGQVFQVVASNGVDRYLTAAQTCNCPAGLKGRRCYHVAAARIITAA